VNKIEMAHKLKLYSWNKWCGNKQNGFCWNWINYIKVLGL